MIRTSYWTDPWTLKSLQMLAKLRVERDTEWHVTVLIKVRKRPHSIAMFFKLFKKRKTFCDKIQCSLKHIYMAEIKQVFCKNNYLLIFILFIPFCFTLFCSLLFHLNIHAGHNSLH